jgi:hypothetical protein
MVVSIMETTTFFIYRCGDMRAVVSILETSGNTGEGNSFLFGNS